MIIIHIKYIRAFRETNYISLFSYQRHNVQLKSWIKSCHYGLPQHPALTSYLSTCLGSTLPPDRVLPLYEDCACHIYSPRPQH